jgi:surface polysaccharide O-acyltransferase-like enzyme
MIWYKTKGKGRLGENVPLLCVFLMGFLPAIGSMFNVFGESPTEFMAYFLLGYFFLARDNLLNKLEKYRHLSLGLFVVTAAFVAFVIDLQFYEVPRWFSILAALGYSKRHLDYEDKVSLYLSKSSFGIYLFHQSWIVVVAFFVFKLTDIPLQQIPLILVISVILTYASYEICRRVPIVRRMLGLKR